MLGTVFDVTCNGLRCNFVTPRTEVRLIDINRLLRAAASSDIRRRLTTSSRSDFKTLTSTNALIAPQIVPDRSRIGAALQSIVNESPSAK